MTAASSGTPSYTPPGNPSDPGSFLERNDGEQEVLANVTTSNTFDSLATASESSPISFPTVLLVCSTDYSPRKLNMFPIIMPILATTSMTVTDMLSPVASCTVQSGLRTDSERNSSAASTPSTKAPPPVTYSLMTSQRIQCDKCARKCVDKEDMKCHILLWHSVPQTSFHNLMTKKKTELLD